MSRIYSELERNQDFPPEPGYLWQWFSDIEQEVVNYTKYTPLEESSHLKVWSPSLANLMTNIGGIIDSFFRSTLSHPIFDNVCFYNRNGNLSGQITDLRKNPKCANISHYCQMFEQVFKISQLTILVKPEKRELFEIQPFSTFSRNKSPYWWSKVYNKLKHQRLSDREYIKRAALKNVITGLGGLLLLQLIFPPNIHYLLDLGIIRVMLPSYNRIEIRKDLEDPSQWEKTDKIIAAKTNLFGYLYPTQKLREKPINPDTDKTYTDCPRKIFSPRNPVGYDTWNKVR